MTVIYGILIAVAALLAAFLVYINLVALLAVRKRKTRDLPRKNASDEQNEAYAATLQKMIQCKTVFGEGNEAEFEKFRAVLKASFPRLHARAELTVFGSGCLVYKISGKNATKNILLMSHHDVVEATGDWNFPPFSGTISDGKIWGRGTVDTKTPLFAELQAAEELLGEGYGFEGVNLYIGSSNNEEICGDGMPLAVAYFKSRNVRFDAVLDEGGAVTTGMMPGVKQKSAMVAVHEKGRHCYVCTAKNENKGHLGLNPTTDSPVGRMSAFIAEIGKSKNLFKKKFVPEVAATFRAHAPYMSYPYRLLFANFGLFRPLLLRVLPKVNNQVKSMLSTTVQFTAIEGSSSAQVQAKEVRATAFFRCVREEDLQNELVAFRKIAAKYGVTVKNELTDYCVPSSSSMPQYRVLEKVLNRNFPDVVVSPYLLTAGSDARRFSDIADCILRFAPLDLSREQYASVHNDNENIDVKNLGQCVCLYKDFVRQTAAMPK